MSHFYDALKPMLEEGLRCPCLAENIPGQPPVIQLEEGTTDRAGCSQCGRYGPIAGFQRPKETRE